MIWLEKQKELKEGIVDQKELEDFLKFMRANNKYDKEVVDQFLLDKLINREKKLSVQK